MKTNPVRGAAWCCALLFSAASLGAQSMTVDTFEGPVTTNELTSFKNYIKTIQPNTWTTVTNMANELSQYNTAQRLRAISLMYEMSGDVEILNRMIYFCDVILTQRNDILPAPYGQKVMWTGTITHDWIQSQTDPNATGNAPAGEGAGHLANCARLILQTPSLLNQVVPDQDLYDHGRTYGERAATFLAEADDVFATTIFPYYLNLANSNRMYFPAAPFPYSPGNSVPWNQQAMFATGLMHAAAAHAILGDNPALVAQYDGIVSTSFNWLFNDAATHTTVTTPQGNTALQWGYSTGLTPVEDNNHGNYDNQWFYRSYLSGRYGITSTQLTQVANAFCDRMILGPRWCAGNVNGVTTGSGNSGPTTYFRDGWWFATEFRPDKFYETIAPSLSPGGTSGNIGQYTAFLWLKSRRNTAGYSVALSPKPDAYSTSQTVTLSSTVGGASIRYTTNGTTPTATSGTLYTGPFSVTQTTTVKAVAYTGTWTSPVTTATYTIWAATPVATPAAGAYVGTQTVTLSSATPGATIRYTLDETTPTQTTGTVYTGAITISSSKTLRAIAYATGYSTSNVRDADYTIRTAPLVAAPVFSPAAGTYSSAQNVTITCATSGAAIYYTTDGSTPTTSSTAYTSPVAIGDGTVLKALAVASGYGNTTTTGNYTIGTTATPTISLAGGSYTGDQTVTLACASSGATIMFTLDGTTPGWTNGYIYTGAFKVKQSATLQVMAFSPLRANSTVASATYTIAAEAPAFSLAAGSYTGTQTVSLSTATVGASIRYTTDGSTPTPTTGTLYSGAIAVSTSQTIKAIAYLGGANNSAVSSATYNIYAKLSVPAANVTASAYTSTFVPANTVDGSLSTRWAGNGDGVWIRYDLGATKTIGYVKLAWYQGTTRTYTFDVQTSTDGTTWTTRINRRVSSGTTTALETYDFTDVSARYVRIVGHLSNVDNYTNITEAEVWGF